jgi:uncharacterized membrane protein YkoI
MKSKVFLFIAIMAMSVSGAFAADLISFSKAAQTARAELDGSVTDIELDGEQRTVAYEVSIFSADGYIHKFFVDAVTGQVTKHGTTNPRQEVARAMATIKVDLDQAQTIASQNLSNAVGAQLTSLDTNVRGGKAIFELDMVDNQGLSYEVRIDAVSGEVLSVKQDEKITNMPVISRADAEAAAMRALAGSVIYTKIDEDKKVAHYEVLMFAEDKLFEVRIDGTSGAVLKMKQED